MKERTTHVIFAGHFQRTKQSFLVHSTTHIAFYIHPSHDSILELWWTFSNRDFH